MFIECIIFFTHACESIDFDNQALRNQILVNVEQKRLINTTIKNNKLRYKKQILNLALVSATKMAVIT